MDEALPDALYYAGIYGLILVATTITVSVTIPLFSALAGALFVVSFIMIAVYLPAATHLKKLRMGAAGELCGSAGLGREFVAHLCAGGACPFSSSLLPSSHACSYLIALVPTHPACR